MLFWSSSFTTFIYLCICLLHVLPLSPFFASSSLVVQAEVVDLTTQQFYTLATSQQVSVIVDVRTEARWSDGHIENSTLAENLASVLAGTPAAEINTTLQSMGLWPCLNCPTIGMYIMQATLCPQSLLPHKLAWNGSDLSSQ
jgi:hypothetical protein